VAVGGCDVAAGVLVGRGVGLGPAVGMAVGVLVGRGVGLGPAVDVAVGVLVGLCVGLGPGVTDADGVLDGRGVGLGPGVTDVCGVGVRVRFPPPGFSLLWHFRQVAVARVWVWQSRQVAPSWPMPPLSLLFG